MEVSTQASYAESLVSKPLFHQQQLYPDVDYYSSTALHDDYQNHFNSYEQDQPSSSSDFPSSDITRAYNALASEIIPKVGLLIAALQTT